MIPVAASSGINFVFFYIHEGAKTNLVVKWKFEVSVHYRCQRLLHHFVLDKVVSNQILNQRNMYFENCKASMIEIYLELLLAIRYYSQDRTNQDEHPVIKLIIISKAIYLLHTVKLNPILWFTIPT
jgi:hypothetical protein